MLRNLITTKARAKHEHLFNKPASPKLDLRLISTSNFTDLSQIKLVRLVRIEK